MLGEDQERAPLPSPLPRNEGSGGTMHDELLTPDEARALIQAASGRAPTGVRNRALVAMMYRSGLRPGEALALTHRRPRRGGRHGERPRAQGRQPAHHRRRRGDAPPARRVDRPPRPARASTPPRRSSAPWPGEPLKAAYVRELLPRLARRAGIAKRVHPLALRYANAAELAEEGMPAPMIDRHLGVAPVGAARRYRRPVSEEEVAAAIAAREWSL